MKNKIKIIHIAQSVGGVDVYLRLVLENIDPIKFENVIISGISDNSKVFHDRNNVEIKNFKIPLVREIKLKNDLKCLYETYKIVKKESPDLIHCHSAKGGVIGRLIGQILGIKVLYTPHAFSYLSAENEFKRQVYLFIEKIMSRFNNKVLATSDSEAERALNDIGYKKSNILLFNNCIKPIYKVEELSIPKTWKDEYICSVGRPSFQKNIELMLDVVRQIKNTRNINLVIMGVGFYSSNLNVVKDKIKDLDLEENVKLLEWTSREDVFNIIKNSKLYISTSRYEGLPYSIIESLALQKSCVVTDCDGNRDLIENGVNGYVINDNNSEDFSKRVIQLLDDDELRTKMEFASYEKFNKNFNINDKIIELENICFSEAGFSNCETFV